MLTPADLLSWNAELGYGFFPVNPGDWPYDEKYRAKYADMAKGDMAKRLNFHRVALTMLAADAVVFKRGSTPTVLDIGPGDGAFIRRLVADLPEGKDYVFGYDVNPAMVERLKEDNRWADPHKTGLWTVMTFWDSFEHIHRPDLTIRNACSVAMSIPLFHNREHVLKSKHFRPDEHVWYFTDAGIKTFMSRCGFVCQHESDAEMQIGREDIKSYVFIRREFAQSQA